MKTLFFILIAFLFIAKSNAQLLPVPTNTKNTVFFWYDENGNRLKRQIFISDCEATVPPPENWVGFGADKKGIAPPLTIKINDDIQLYPNPTIENVQVSIHTHKIMEKATISVRNIDGKIIFIKEFVSNNSVEIIPFENFVPGTYIVFLKLNSNETLSWKVIKN